MSKMDRKPWQNNGPHRAPFGSDRREGGRSDRREGGERGFGRREFGDRREFGGERRGFGERREFSVVAKTSAFVPVRVPARLKPAASPSAPTSPRTPS